MTPLAWLRSRPRRHTDVVVECATDERIPTGIITSDATLTKTDVEQLRTAFLQAVTQMPTTPRPDFAPDCGCVPRYTSCRCGRQT